MNCSGCGRDFDEAAGRKNCQSCALFGGCRQVRCPHCGYEMPAEPDFIKWLRRRLSSPRKEAGSGGANPPQSKIDERDSSARN